MSNIGILAYGSLIEDPGSEINPLISERQTVETPFCIEFARSSSSRNNAPTVIPVERGGSRVQATIFVLDASVSLEIAKDLLWRRETRNESSGKHYKRPSKPNNKSVVIEELKDFDGINVVIYTKIGANISGMSPAKLAELAINSVKAEVGKDRNDGISYLISLKRQGISTPLMSDYEREILKKTNTLSLEKSLVKCLSSEVSL